jgi:Na+/proline symporter
MVETRIKPHFQQAAEEERRVRSRRAFTAATRFLALVLVAAAICAWWLFHTNPKWIFPPGWWRP